MKRPIAWVVASILVMCTGAEGLTLIVADPGHRYGTVLIGSPPMRGWTIHCHFYPPYNSRNDQDLWFYPDQGLYAQESLSDRGRVESIRPLVGHNLLSILGNVPATIVQYLCKGVT